MPWLRPGFCRHYVEIRDTFLIRTRVFWGLHRGSPLSWQITMQGFYTIIRIIGGGYIGVVCLSRFPATSQVSLHVPLTDETKASINKASRIGTLRVYWDNGIMEKKMETTRVL